MHLKPKPRNLKPKTTIDLEVRHYRNLKHAPLSTIIGKPETKSIWFSIDQIQEMWDELVYQAINNRKKVSGVRVYLTSYLPGGLFENQMGIVFVLTEDIGGPRSIHKDFFIEEQPDWSSRPGPTSMSVPTSILGLDQGTPCPPDCDSGQGQDPNWP